MSRNKVGRHVDLKRKEMFFLYYLPDVDVVNMDDSLI